MKNQEWCYVADTKPGGKNWEYCQPIMDYDKVREDNQKMLQEISRKANEADLNIKQNIVPAKNALDELNNLKNDQAKLDTDIASQKKTIDNINLNLQSLQSSRAIWEKQNELITKLNFEIEKKKKKKGNQRDPFICEGMLLYEDETLGDGLIGYYYDNENWLGSYQEHKDKNIDFDFTGSAPHDLNPNNFSIHWEGFLYAPTDGNYIFVIEADDGAILNVNDMDVVIHRQNIRIEISNKTQHPYKTYSAPVKLFGGTKVKISLKYYHSVHNDINEDGLCFIKLYWYNEEIKEKIIAGRYLYSSNSFPPLKVFDFNYNDSTLKKLYENDTAFKNSDNYLLQDIPPEFVGSSMLKMITRFQKDVLLFSVNTPTIVYVAYLSHYPKFLPEEFENTGLVMSLLQIDKGLVKTAKRLTAKKSGKLLIYKKKFAKGEVRIKLHKVGINQKGIPMIMFFGFDSKANAPIECGGKPIEVSNSTSKFFQSCKASTEKEGWNCEAGFSGKNRDEEGGMWASNNEGIGAWVSIKFNGLFEILKFVYKDRKNPAERNSHLILTFSNGETQDIFLKNTDEETTFNVDHIKATGVKIMIKGVYGTMNNGGAFSFVGIRCKSGDEELDDDEDKKHQNKLIPFFVKSSLKLVTLNCRDSFSNTHKFDNLIIKPNVKVNVKCPESCANSDVPVYGIGQYSKDSAICRSAFHAQKIGSRGGIVTIVFRGAMSNFRSETSNGIKSEGKATSEFSMSFEAYEEDDIILVKAGSKVDVFHLGRPMWLPGIITEVIDNNKGKFIKYIVEGRKFN